MSKSNMVGLLALLFIFIACNNESSNPSKPTHDTPTSGTINISVDESFRTVIEEQIKVYEASFPGTKINAFYKSEVDCFRDLYDDSSTRMVIVTRGVSRKEAAYFNSNFNYSPTSDPIARDAIAIVVPKGSGDTLFTMQGLKNLLTGKSVKKPSVVFDGLNATSTYRFVNDSILRGEKLDTTVVRAVKDSKSVLEYVSTHPNSIGFVGVSWIGNPEKIEQTEMMKKLHLAYIRCDVCEFQPYVLPSQQSMDTKRYPLVRNLYYILKENYSGLGSGFAQFLKYERGQLIFRRAYLAPRMDFEVRRVIINE